MRERGLPHVSFPAALGERFIGPRHGVVVVGTHGKTTTSAMMGALPTAGNLTTLRHQLAAGLYYTGRSDLSLGALFTATLIAGGAVLVTVALTVGVVVAPVIALALGFWALQRREAPRARVVDI